MIWTRKSLTTNEIIEWEIVECVFTAKNNEEVLKRSTLWKIH